MCIRDSFKNYVLYAQDVFPGANGTAQWQHVFLADLSNPASPHIITANQATVVSNGPQTLRMEPVSYTHLALSPSS